MTKNRNPWIDSLRGVAVLMVVSMHFWGNLNESFTHLSTRGLWVFYNGYYGVSIFFVISGFLITSNLLTRYGSLSAIPLSDFYVMRFSRIAPCLILLILLLWVLNQLDVPNFKIASDAGVTIYEAIWKAATFQYNNFYNTYGVTKGLLAWAMLWSLSIEELFYLIYPVLCVAIRSKLALEILLAAVVIQGPIARADPDGLTAFFGCADLLAIGCLTAITANEIFLTNGFRWLLRLLGAALMLAVYLFVHIYEYKCIGPTLVGVGASGFLLASANRGNPSALGWFSRHGKLLQRFGALSYEIYLFHLTVLFAAFAFFLPSTPAPAPVYAWLLFCAFLILLLGTGHFLSLFFAEPLNRLLRTRFITRADRALTRQTIAANEPAGNRAGA
jgi:peptidoglycan/LPS O-acetylase OafA/YrhL